MSASIPIQSGQRWTYVGPNGRKAMHTVVEATPHHVITFSDPFPISVSDRNCVMLQGGLNGCEKAVVQNAGGESWLGSPSTFKTVFRRANSCE